MISPRMWMLKRPGTAVPVFFLCLLPVWGQIHWQEAETAARGGAFAASRGNFNSRNNQAGLGWIESHSLSLHHSRPFILKELGISSLSAQLHTGKGALGTTFTSFGIPGLRVTSVWISYGMQLHPGITAGLGIHGWTYSTGENRLFTPGISCALGIQGMIGERMLTGIHILHPVGWEARSTGVSQQPMVLTAGFAYTLFHVITFYTDLQMTPDSPLKSCHGLELSLEEQIQVQLGMHNRPFAVSGGITLTRTSWTFSTAFEYMLDSGGTPSTSLTYAW